MTDHIYITGVCLLMILCAFFLATLAQSQEIHHHAGMSPEVDQFYSTWMMPEPRTNGERTQGCCNKKDCHPAIIRYNLDKSRWEGRYTGTVYQRDFWLAIPDQKLEENAPDPRESPDGQSHMCGSSMSVYCAVRGSGQ